MVTLKIARFNPRTRTPRASRASGCLPAVRPAAEPADLRQELSRRHPDVPLVLTHGVLGSDAIRINGVNQLACKVLMRDLLPKGGKPLTVTIEPIRGLPVEKDLV